MKKIVFASLFSLLGLNLMAQEDYGRTMAISLAPLKAVAGTAALVYQAKLSDNFALTVPVHFSYHWPAAHAFKWLKLGEVEETKKPISYGAGLGARFLLSGNGLNDSFYLEPRVAFSYNQFGYQFKGENLSAEFERYQLGPEFRFGWDWYYDSGLYLNLGFGAGYSFFLKNDVKESGDIDAKRTDKWAFRQAFPKKDALGMLVAGVDFAIGYAW